MMFWRDQNAFSKADLKMMKGRAGNVCQGETHLAKLSAEGPSFTKINNNIHLTALFRQRNEINFKRIATRVESLSFTFHIIFFFSRPCQLKFFIFIL